MLAKQVVAAGFFGFSTRYTNHDEGCKAIVSDQPTALFTVSLGAETKAVFYYFGCRGMPQADALVSLALEIDTAANIRDLGGYYE